jgi:hypothetical protein
VSKTFETGNFGLSAEMKVKSGLRNCLAQSKNTTGSDLGQHEWDG